MRWIKCGALLFCTTATPKIGNCSIKVTLLGLLASLVTSNPALAFEYEWDKHQFDFGFRPRLAVVERDRGEDARAASLLLRLRAESEWSRQFTTLIEVDHVELGWENDFSNGENFNDNKPVIPDVAGTDLNQAWLRYSPTNTLEFTLGREAVELANQRFVGTNSFWQNQQTLDNAGIKYRFGTASSVSYRYVDNVNRINGDNAGARLSPNDSNFQQTNGQRPPQFLGDHDHQSHLIFAQIKEWDYSRVQAYYFDMDIKDALAVSNQTLGTRYDYKGRIGDFRAAAHAELAVQERSEVNQDALLSYYDIGAGLGLGSSEISVNYERLGEDDGTAFITPLASLHDQNGWADQFLITPNRGLRDYSVQYIWRKSPWQIDARYHFFHADNTHNHLGEELDIDFSVTFSRNSTLLLRVADFTTNDDNYSDERRVFLMYIYNL